MFEEVKDAELRKTKQTKARTQAHCVHKDTLNSSCNANSVFVVEAGGEEKKGQVMPQAPSQTIKQTNQVKMLKNPFQTFPVRQLPQGRPF